MTEREKKIEEMAKIAKGCEENRHAECITHPYCFGVEAATRLYDAGYRKADEVRKETVKMFLDKIMERTITLYDPLEIPHIAVVRRDIIEIAEEFGVEVDE